MALLSSRWLRISKFAAPVALIILFNVYYWTNLPLLPFSRASWRITDDDRPILEEPRTEEQFIKEASIWEIDGPFNDTPLRDLCASKEWQLGLIFRCETAFGGVGNVRNIILTCIRYAIEAGATSLIVPQIEARGTDLINLHEGRRLPLTYMFDEDFFKTSLSTACPQITIIQSESLLDPSINRAELLPKELGLKFKVDRVIDFAAGWRGLFDNWILYLRAPSGFNESAPLLVSVRPSWFEWPILHDSTSFIATFGRILRFNQTFLDLASIVLYALDQEHKLGVDPGKIGVPAKGKFYGAHLRTAQDAVAASFATYEEQSSAYLASAKEQQLSVIYLASGSPPDIVRFTEAAAKKSIKVTTKLALLEGKPEFVDALKELQALTWDQQALIDYMVLLRSSHFGGTWASSFSYNIVFRRHVVVGNGEWVPSKSALEAKGSRSESSWGFDHVEKRELRRGECYGDAINSIFGLPLEGIWFELSMWP